MLNEYSESVNQRLRGHLHEELLREPRGGDERGRDQAAVEERGQPLVQLLRRDRAQPRSRARRPRPSSGSRWRGSSAGEPEAVERVLELSRAQALPRPEALRPRGQPHARGRAGARSASRTSRRRAAPCSPGTSRRSRPGRPRPRALWQTRRPWARLPIARATPSSPAAGCAATTSSAARDLIREILEGERHSLWVLGGAPARQDQPAEGARAPRPAQPRDPVRGALLGPPGQRRRPRARRDAARRASRTPRPSAGPPTSTVEDLESLPVADMLATLVRRTVRSGWRLLLLVDEAEELLVVGRADPGVLARLRRVLSRGPDVRTVHHRHAAPRAARRGGAAADVAVPPGLHPAHLPDPPRPPTRAAPSWPAAASPRRTRSSILERTACHPFLAPAPGEPPLREPRPGGHPRPAGGGRDGRQLLRGGLRRPSRRRSARCSPRWRARARGPGRSSRRALARPEEDLETPLYGLSMLGYLAREGDSWRLGNWLFERWLRRRVTAAARTA